VYPSKTNSKDANMINTNQKAFTDLELDILRTLVDRTHTRNLETGMGNSAGMNGLLRKLNTLTDNEAANNE
jgi:hypothetical protein